MLCEGVQPGQIDAPACSARHAPNGAARCGLPKIAGDGQHSRCDGGLAWRPAIDGCGDPPNLSGVQWWRASRFVYGFEDAGQFVKVARAIMETATDAGEDIVALSVRYRRPGGVDGHRGLVRSSPHFSAAGAVRPARGLEEPFRGVSRWQAVEERIRPLISPGWRRDDIPALPAHVQTQPDPAGGVSYLAVSRVFEVGVHPPATCPNG